MSNIVDFNAWRKKALSKNRKVQVSAVRLGAHLNSDEVERVIKAASKLVLSARLTSLGDLAPVRYV